MNSHFTIFENKKESYKKLYPDHVVLLNSCVFGEKSGKLWCGDVDLTVDYDSLVSISEKLNESLYVLHNSDTQAEGDEIANRAIAKIKTKKYA